MTLEWIDLCWLFIFLHKHRIYMSCNAASTPMSRREETVVQWLVQQAAGPITLSTEVLLRGVSMISLGLLSGSCSFLLSWDSHMQPQQREEKKKRKVDGRANVHKANDDFTARSDGTSELVGWWEWCQGALVREHRWNGNKGAVSALRLWGIDANWLRKWLTCNEKQRRQQDVSAPLL